MTLSKRARRRLRGRSKEQTPTHTKPATPQRMYAPIWFGGMWHLVNPLNLVRPICNSGAVLNAQNIRNELPPDVDYCSVCSDRVRFADVAAGRW